MQGKRYALASLYELAVVRNTVVSGLVCAYPINAASVSSKNKAGFFMVILICKRLIVIIYQVDFMFNILFMVFY
jgi:hypothetical protein